MLELEKIRSQFPVLSREINGRPLVYLDSAATAQKPTGVIEAVSNYYRSHNANVHRGVHTLAEEATQLYEEARLKVARFLGAKDASEIIFVRNATEALNLVVWSWGKANIHSGDEILLSEMEHHSNIVPWQMLAKEVGASIKYIPFGKDGQLEMNHLPSLLSARTKVVSLVHVSNSLGTINPVGEIIRAAHEKGAVVVLDGAQSVPHLKVNVQSFGVDFLAFSGHKMLAPMGIGVLYGRSELLGAMPPFLGGGDMIRTVNLSESTWNDLPYKFEAGTPNVGGAVGLGAAIDFLTACGMEDIRRHEVELTAYCLERIQSVPGLTIYGPLAAPRRGGVVAFTIQGAHPHDLASILDGEGIAVRSGHHCTIPVHLKLGIPASTRASFYLYNVRSEVDRLVEGLIKAAKILKI